MGQGNSEKVRAGKIPTFHRETLQTKRSHLICSSSIIGVHQQHQR